MARPKFETVDEYIASLPDEAAKMLTTVRETIRGSVPGAEEVISYGIPATKYHGWLLYFAAFKEHYSLSTPPPTGMWETFAEQLKRYKTSKSAIQFPFAEPVPVDLISAIAKFRATENTTRDP
jgi:uncharacterized protein YdhG (YjbR/CyaY superfamily)